MISVLSTLFLLAGIQGILLAVLLLSKKKNRPANTILSLGILALSLDLFAVFYEVNEYFFQYPHFLGITFGFPLVYGPLFYFYTRFLVVPDSKFKTKDFLHFIPFLLLVLYMMPSLLMNGEEKILYVLSIFSGNQIDYIIFAHLKPLHGVIYVVFTIKLINLHNEKIKKSFSNIEKINLKWLKNLLVGIVVVWCIVIISLVIDDFFQQYAFKYDFAIYFSISILIYGIGYMGLNQPDIFNQEEEILTTTKSYEADKSEPETAGYKKSGLSDSCAEKISNDLLNLFNNEKPYLDSELTLGKLAGVLNISPHNLSEVINSKLKQNFYEMVNGYRVEEVKRKLQSPEYDMYSILGIAYESGFNSKTSFNTIFKKYVGQTPSDYKRMNVQK